MGNGGSDPKKEKRRGEIIWRRMVHGQYKSMRGEKSGEQSCGRRMMFVPMKC